MKATNDDMAGGGGVAHNPHSVDRRSIPQDVVHAAVTLAFDAQQDAVITYDGQEYCAELEARRASQEDVIVFVIPKWTHRDFAPSEVGAGYVYDTGGDNWVLMKNGQPLSDEAHFPHFVTTFSPNLPAAASQRPYWLAGRPSRARRRRWTWLSSVTITSAGRLPCLSV